MMEGIPRTLVEQRNIYVSRAKKYFTKCQDKFNMLISTDTKRTSLNLVKAIMILEEGRRGVPSDE